ncbi:MAG: hypothetical protein P8P37_01655 [Candidatus Marinimicrobia bacterium]|nr:hypothetical protein [Candidatus Neomarinimicrobiota bacterium]
MSKAIRSTIVNNVMNGAYIRQRKFANWGSVIEDSIFAQQKEFERKLVMIQQAKKNKIIK